MTPSFLHSKRGQSSNVVDNQQCRSDRPTATRPFQSHSSPPPITHHHHYNCNHHHHRTVVATGSVTMRKQPGERGETDEDAADSSLFDEFDLDGSSESGADSGDDDDAGVSWQWMKFCTEPTDAAVFCQKVGKKPLKRAAITLSLHKGRNDGVRDELQQCLQSDLNHIEEFTLRNASYLFDSDKSNMDKDEQEDGQKDGQGEGASIKDPPRSQDALGLFVSDSMKRLAMASVDEPLSSFVMNEVAFAVKSNRCLTEIRLHGYSDLSLLAGAMKDGHITTLTLEPFVATNETDDDEDDTDDDNDDDDDDDRADTVDNNVVDMTEGHVDHQYATYRSILQDNKELVSLALQGHDCQLAVRYVAPALPLATLTALQISRVPSLSFHCLSQIASGLRPNRLLRVLELVDCGIGSRQLKGLCGLFQEGNSNVSIQTINLADNNVADDGIECLFDALTRCADCRLDETTALTTLILRNNNITCTGASCIATYLRLGSRCQLRDLRLNGNPIRFDGQRDICNALATANPPLRQLRMSCKFVLAKSLHLPDILRSNTHLESLAVCAPVVLDADLLEIRQAIDSNRVLKHLLLWKEQKPGEFFEVGPNWFGIQYCSWRNRVGFWDVVSDDNCRSVLPMIITELRSRVCKAFRGKSVRRKVWNSCVFDLLRQNPQIFQ